MSTSFRFIVLFVCVLAVVPSLACADDAPAPSQPPTATAVVVPRTATALPPSPTATAMRVPEPTRPPPTIAPTPLPFTAVPATPTPEVKSDDRRGGTLNLVSRQTILHQDVHHDVSAALAAWGPGIAYSRLMRFRSGPNVELPSLAVECEVCRDWTMVDGMTFEFMLRDDVNWQDIHPVNGRQLTAGDIAFSYERQRAEGAPNGALLHIVDTIEAPADDLLRVSLHAPDADSLGALADGHSKIVAREAVALNGDLLNGPTVGSGAWIFQDTQSDTAYGFERNDGYFGDDAPLLDRLRIHAITDRDTAYAAFRVNNVDVHQLRPDEWEEFTRQKPDASMRAFKEIGTGLEVAFKTTAPPFDDVRVRQAAMFSMRPERAIQEIWQSAAYLTQGVPLGRADWRLSDDELAGYFNDQSRATALLGGAVDRLPIPVSIKVGDFGEEYRAHAERIATDMRNVGFEPQLDVVDKRRFGERVWFGGEYEMFVGPTAPIASPNGYMLAVLSSEGAWNTTEHRNDALDALILAQAGEYDADARRRLVVEAQRLALENAYRFMPAATVSLWAWWPNVKGLDPNFVGSEYSHWERVWIGE